MRNFSFSSETKMAVFICRPRVLQIKVKIIWEVVALINRAYLGVRNWETRLCPQRSCCLNSSFSKECSVTQSCPTLWDPKDRSMSGSSVLHLLPEFAQTHVHRVSDAIQPSHPLSPPSPPTLNLSQHQGLFQWVGSSHQKRIFQRYQGLNPSAWLLTALSGNF